MKGYVLIVVLLVVAALTASAVELAHGVFVNINGLHNMMTLEKLSIEGSSLIKNLSGRFREALTSELIPVGQEEMAFPLDEDVTISFKVDDENSKFNINTLIYPDGSQNKDALRRFQRLLEILKLDSAIADRATDWIDKDSLPMPRGNEKAAKNTPFESLPELALLTDSASYEALKGFVSVHGDGLVNINSAPPPVLMSLSEEVSREMAGRVVAWREQERFKNIGELARVAGFEKAAMTLAPLITVKPTALRLWAMAEEGGIKRAVETVADANGKILYWREF